MEYLISHCADYKQLWHCRRRSPGWHLLHYGRAGAHLGGARINWDSFKGTTNASILFFYFFERSTPIAGLRWWSRVAFECKNNMWPSIGEAVRLLPANSCTVPGKKNSALNDPTHPPTTAISSALSSQQAASNSVISGTLLRCPPKK